MRNQTALTLNLLRNGPITQFDARDNFILCITARISELRHLGYSIVCKRDPIGKFGIWTLLAEPENPYAFR